MNKQINGVIAIIKFFYVNLIVVIHTGMPWREGRLLSGSYIFCDFMFMVMGYYGNYVISDSKKFTLHKAVWYIVARLKKWFFYIAVSDFILLFLLIIQSANSTGITYSEVYRLIVKYFCDLSFLRAVVPSLSSINGSLWFLQAAMWGGCLLMLISTIPRVKYVQPCLVLYSIIAITIYCRFYYKVGHFDDWWDTSILLVVQDGLMRGIAGISVGVLLRVLVEKLKEFFKVGVSIVLRVILRSVVWLTFIITIFLTLRYNRSRVDFIQLALFGVMIVVNGIDNNYLNTNFTVYINNITFLIYCTQFISINIFLCFMCNINKIEVVIAILCTNFVIANLFMKFGMLLGKENIYANFSTSRILENRRREK